MSRKLLGNVTPKCAYCKHGVISSDGESVLCRKKGVLDKNSGCKKFSYDPLKRIPEAPPELPTFSADEFKL